MKTLADVMTQALDYLAYHFPTIAFEVDTRSHALRLTAPGQPQQTVIITFDGIFPGYTYDGREHTTLVNLALAIGNATQQSIHFGSSVIDDVQTLSVPCIDFPFRMKRITGTRSETYFLFHPETQKRLVAHFDSTECARAIRYNEQHPIDPEVINLIHERYKYLRTQVSHPGKTHQLPDTYATAPGVQP